MESINREERREETEKTDLTKDVKPLSETVGENVQNSRERPTFPAYKPIELTMPQVEEVTAKIKNSFNLKDPAPSVLQSYGLTEIALLSLVASSPENTAYKNLFTSYLRETGKEDLAYTFSLAISSFNPDECWYHHPQLHQLNKLMEEYWSPLATATNLRLKTVTHPCGRMTSVDEHAHLLFVQGFPSVAVSFTKPLSSDNTPKEWNLIDCILLLQKFQVEIGEKKYYVGVPQDFSNLIY